MNNYENIFRWMKKATKTERHIEELELFAKKHPIIFMKFHKECNAIIKYDESDPKYIKAKEGQKESAGTVQGRGHQSGPCLLPI